MAKSKRHAIQWPKVKDTQYNDQKYRTRNPLYCMSFTFDHCTVCPLLLAIVLCVLYFWSLYCVSFTFGHCIVCLLLLIIVLCVLYFWSLYCVSFTFGHCIVCPLLLTIVLYVFYFWSLYCVSFTFDHCKSKGHTIQWPKVKDTQYNEQK
jgi:Sec-independent protein secretion pathway component TatC